MDDSQRQLLEEPFPVSIHRTRRGAHGRELVYVATPNYIDRLNQSFCGAWSFEVVSHQVLEFEVVVLGRLTAAGISKVAFGGSAITRSRETGETLSLADDLKSASSDALKKCCSLLGVGLALYSEVPEPVLERPAEIPRRPAAASSGQTPGDTPKLTQRQFQVIQGLADRAGIAEDDLAGWVQRSFGVAVAELDRRQASEVITKINQSLAGGNGNGGNGRAAGGVA